VPSGTEVARDFQERYGAPGFPVVALYDTEGQLQDVLFGYVDADQMLQALQSVQ
jgi:thioredoxin-related protein